MAMTFYEKFKKYAPTDAEREILDHITAFTPKVDVENRYISVYADFDAYIPPYRFDSIEQNIKAVYELNYMSLHPTYTGTEFDIRYMDAVFYELAKLTAQGLGFFNGAEAALEGADITVGEDDTLHISLKNGGKELLLYTECDKLISDVVFRMFGKRLKIDFCGITKLNYEDFIPPPMPYIAPRSKEELETENLEKAASLTNSISSADVKTEIDSVHAKITVGEMCFDISDIKDVHGRIKSLDATPLRALTLDSENFTVCGVVFSFQKKLTRKEDRYIVSFYVTDNDSSAVVKWIYDAERDGDYSCIKDGAAVMIRGSMQMDKFENIPVIRPSAIALIKRKKKTDTAEKKRVELHLHTTLSTMDSTFSPEAVVETVSRFGHTAVAITDHGNLQAYPEIMTEAEKVGADFKIIYGIESYFVDDTATAVFGSGAARSKKTRSVYLISKPRDFRSRIAPLPRSARYCIAAARFLTNSRALSIRICLSAPKYRSLPALLTIW